MIIKEWNDPSIQPGDTVRFKKPSLFMIHSPLPSNFKIIEGECTVLEIDDKRLLEKL